MSDHQVFQLGDFELQSGIALRDAILAYKTYGTLSAERDNVILYPTWYGGQHTDNEWLIGQGMALDPDRYFIVVPNMFGNGLSSSPGNTRPPSDAVQFPNVTIYDNVMAQHRLLTEHLGIERMRLVTGWSMGGLQTFHWGALFPGMMDLLAPFCGSARCSRHNYVFLEGLKAALTADAAFHDGRYKEPPLKGLRAFARVYAGWGFSQSFYRERLDINALGFASLEDFLTGYWETIFLTQDANNLLAMLWTWQNGDVAANPVFRGDFQKALRSIVARTYVMPGQTDLYFPPEDSQLEVAGMPNAELVPIPSIWGHSAGGPGVNPVDVKFIDDRLKDLLGDNRS